jgi:hypothetical protein
MIVFGVDLNKVQWALFAYIIASILFLYYGIQKVYATGTTRGIIFGIGSLLVLFYFYLRWFGSSPQVSSKWPPIINSCPDYLTYVPKIPTTAGSSSKVPGCIDLLGVSSRQSSGSSGSVFSKVTPTQVTGLDASQTNKVFSFTSADVKAATSTAALQTICNACQNAGLTWEGVWDGDSCIGVAKVDAQNAALQRCLVSA